MEGSVDSVLCMAPSVRSICADGAAHTQANPPHTKTRHAVSSNQRTSVAASAGTSTITPLSVLTLRCIWGLGLGRVVVGRRSRLAAAAPAAPAAVGYDRSIDRLLLGPVSWGARGDGRESTSRSHQHKPFA